LLEAVGEVACLVGEHRQALGVVAADIEEGSVVDDSLDLPNQAVLRRSPLVLDGFAAQVDLGRIGRKAHARTVVERVLVTEA